MDESEFKGLFYRMLFPRQLFLRGLWPGRIDGPGLAAEGVRHPDRDVWKSETSDECLEDGLDYMSPLPGSRDPDGDSVGMVNEGRVTNIPGKTEGKGTVYGLWWWHDDGVDGGASEKSAWRGLGR